MIASLEDARWPGCLSAFRLDRFRLGELPPPEAAQVQAHLLGCALCREASDVLGKAEADFRASAIPLQASPRDWRRALLWGSGAVAAAAACLLAFSRRRPSVARGHRPPWACTCNTGRTSAGRCQARPLRPGTRCASSTRVESRAIWPSSAATAPAWPPSISPAARKWPPSLRRRTPFCRWPPASTASSGRRRCSQFCAPARARSNPREALQASPQSLPEVPGCRLATFHFTKHAP